MRGATLLAVVWEEAAYRTTDLGSAGALGQRWSHCAGTHEGTMQRPTP